MIILISWENEIYELDFSKDKHTISFAISCFIIFVFWVTLFGIFITGKHIAQDPFFDIDKSYFNELFHGTNSSIIGRQTVMISVIRVIICVTWVICASGLTKYFRIISYFTIQIIFTVFKLIRKPFEHLTDNFIEYLNDIFYLIASGWLIHYNTESKWTDALLSSYMILIWVNGVLIALVQIFVLLKSCKCNKVTQIRKIQPDVTTIRGNIVNFNLHKKFI